MIYITGIFVLIWKIRPHYVTDLGPHNRSNTSTSQKHLQRRAGVILWSAHAHTYIQTPHPEAGHAVCSSSLAVSCPQRKETEDKEPRSFQSFNGTTWHQRGSEARQTDREEVFSLSHSPGHFVLLTFRSGNTKRDGAPKSILSGLCAQQVGGRSMWSWQMAQRMALCLFVCVCLSVWGVGNRASMFFSWVPSSRSHCLLCIILWHIRSRALSGEEASVALVLAAYSLSFLFHPCSTDCFFSPTCCIAKKNR